MMLQQLPLSEHALRAAVAPANVTAEDVASEVEESSGTEQRHAAPPRPASKKRAHATAAQPGDDSAGRQRKAARSKSPVVRAVVAAGTQQKGGRPKGPSKARDTNECFLASVYMLLGAAANEGQEESGLIAGIAYDRVRLRTSRLHAWRLCPRAQVLTRVLTPPLWCAEKCPRQDGEHPQGGIFGISVQAIYGRGIAGRGWRGTDPC
jgi:hypothetical protein